MVEGRRLPGESRSSEPARRGSTTMQKTVNRGRGAALRMGQDDGEEELELELELQLLLEAPPP